MKLSAAMLCPPGHQLEMIALPHLWLPKSTCGDPSVWGSILVVVVIISIAPV